MYLSPTERNNVSENMPFFGGWYVIAKRAAKLPAKARSSALSEESRFPEERATKTEPALKARALAWLRPRLPFCFGQERGLRPPARHG